jgi:ketosteroid isomerase-like protein
MSQANVEIVRRGYEALARADLPSWLRAFDPAVVLHENASFPDSPTTYRGHAGVLMWLESVNEVWEDPRLEPRAFRSQGDVVLVSARATARGREGRVPIDESCITSSAFGTAKIAEAWGYSDQGQALEAALAHGLGSMHPFTPN